MLILIVQKIRLRYSLLNPKEKILNEAQLLNEANYELAGIYPAAEFDDIAEFLLFLKEAGVERKPAHHIVSEWREGDEIFKFHYSLVPNDLESERFPKEVRGTYQLIKKESA